MGRDRNFPTFFGAVHRKMFTPHFAILASVAIVVLMSASLEIEDVASAADIMFLLLFLQVNITLIRLRKKRPDLDRGFITPLFPYLTIAGIACLLFLAVYMFNYSPLGWFVTAGWITAGLVVYRFYASKREVEHVRRTTALERLERKDFTILVPLQDPASAPSLIALALAIAAKHDSEIVLLHVIEVDQGVPLRAGMEEGKRVVPFLEEARRAVEEADVPVISTVEVSHRVSQGILETALEEDANFILLGREQRPDFLDRVEASVIDTVLDEAPCEVAVLHGRFDPRSVKNVLIPFGENVHTRLALEIAPSLVAAFGCAAEIAVVVDPRTPEEQLAEATASIDEQLKETGLEADVRITRAAGVREGIVRRSRSADLILMGGRSGDFLGLLFGRSLTQEITEGSACPVLWVNEYEERRPFWKLLLTSARKEEEELHG
jgi:nucleotide-binding universal stress UspA family protein